MPAAWAYNHATGSFPGPTFVAASGASVSVDFTNGLALQASSVHWHGMVVETAQDGQPQDVLSPGQQRRYAFTIRQRAALNWYHPHPHMDTGEQVNLGLAGAFIVRDAEAAALGLPGGSYEVPLIVRDANFDKKGNLAYNPRKSGFVGRQPLVNGTLSPTPDVAPELYRLRVLNGANARLFMLGLRQAGVSRPFWLLGNDGGLLGPDGQADQHRIRPGRAPGPAGGLSRPGGRHAAAADRRQHRLGSAGVHGRRPGRWRRARHDQPEGRAALVDHRLPRT
jgi:blue copper oxidase